MKFGVINLGSIEFYNLYVHRVNSLNSNLRASCLDFELSHSMSVFNVVNVRCYE